MNFYDPVWKSTNKDKSKWSIENSFDNERLDPLPESWKPTEEYLTQAEMQEFLDTFAELLHRVVDICTILAKGPGEMNKN